MVKTSLDDLFSLVQPGTLARRVFKGDVQLQHFQTRVFVPDQSYTIEQFMIGANEQHHYQQLRDLCEGVRDLPGSKEFGAGVIEAFKNAYEHGHKKNKKKKIEVAYKETLTQFEIIINDRGGQLHADFIPFVLMHRQGVDKPVSFYTFAPNVKQRPENGGVGTYLIHSFSDEVHYFKNQYNGLGVQLIKYKARE